MTMMMMMKMTKVLFPLFEAEHREVEEYYTEKKSAQYSSSTPLSEPVADKQVRALPKFKETMH